MNVYLFQQNWLRIYSKEKSRYKKKRRYTDACFRGLMWSLHYLYCAVIVYLRFIIEGQTIHVWLSDGLCLYTVQRFIVEYKLCELDILFTHFGAALLSLHMFSTSGSSPRWCWNQESLPYISSIPCGHLQRPTCNANPTKGRTFHKKCLMGKVCT